MTTEKLIHIGSDDYSAEELIVTIPHQYVDYFRNVRFNNMSEFSRALAFAKCAQEARFYEDASKIRQYEVSLAWFLENRHI